MLVYKKEPSITIVDSLMGTGKTEFSFQYIKENPDQRFIVVTPYLSEIKRFIKETITKRKFKEPTSRAESGRKLNSLKQLLTTKEDIVTTHQLFQMLDDDILELIAEGNYTLILDESLEVINPISITKSDFNILQDLIEIDSNNKVSWKDEDYSGRFQDLKKEITKGNVYSVNGNLLWVFNVDVFNQFEQVLILTYLFEGSLLKPMLELNKIAYTKKTVKATESIYKVQFSFKGEDFTNRTIPEFELVDHYNQDKTKFKKLIVLCDYEKLNNIGKKPDALGRDSFTFTSLTRKNPELWKKLNNNLRTFVRSVEGKHSEVMFTCPKEIKNKVGINFQKQFVSSNARATNEFKDRTILVYYLNRFANPLITSYFKSQGVEVDEELFALSELVQWMFRSAIRTGKPINLYIPSKRMRLLLEAWLNNEI